MYDYKYLPELSRYLLDNHLEELSRDFLFYSRQLHVPLLNFLQHLDDEQIIELSNESTAEILRYLSRNKAREQIEDSLNKWLSNQLEVVGKYDIVAEDITLINHVRGKVFKKWAINFGRDQE